MRRLVKSAGEKATAVCAAAAALPFPPVTAADIEDEWNHTKQGIVPQFDMEFSADGAADLTVAELLAGIATAQVLANDDVDTVDFANNELDVNGHIYQSGDGPVQLTTITTLPTGLALATDYWIIYVGVNTIQLAASRKDALAGTAVAFSDVGVGTHTIVDTADTERVIWGSYGLLGQAGDGAISLTAAKGFTQRLGHRARVVAYGVEATISANNITIAVYPATEG